MGSSKKEVNSILHLLRGEDFRRLQNQRRSRSHLSTRSSSTIHSLPPADYFLDDEISLVPHSNRTGRRGISGPPPPPSWLTRSSNEPNPQDPRWRTEALKPFFHSIPTNSNTVCDSQSGSLIDFFNPLPSLLEMCIDLILLDRYEEDGISNEIVPYIPIHLRQAISRRAAIFSPLKSKELVQLYRSPDLEGNSSSSVEIIIAGPSSDISFQTYSSLFNDQTLDASPNDWDETIPDTPLEFLAILSAPFPSLTIPTIPPTLTHLALLNLPVPSVNTNTPPIWRLPAYTPLITFFDLSYNSHWLIPSRVFGKIPWASWTKLEFLGLRVCGFESEELRDMIRLKINSSIKGHNRCIVQFDHG